MKKKLLSLALVLVMALTLLPTAAFAEGETLDAPEDMSGITNSGQLDTSSGDQKIDNSLPADNNQLAGGEQKDADLNPTADPHTHAIQQAVPAEAATCTRRGNIAYWVCSCGAWFSNESLTTEIDDKSSVYIDALGHDFDNGYCTRENCGAKDPDTTQTHTCDPKPVAAKDPSCTEQGNKAYYKCACGKIYFLQGSYFVPATLSETVISATGHKAPPAASFTADKVTSSYHTYDCTACDAKGLSERHTPDASGKCTVCGFEGGSSGGSTTNPSTHYIDISSAYVGDYSISVTWTSDLPSGTYFDIYVDGGFRTTVAPSKSSGYFSYTVDFSRYLGDNYYTVAVYAHDNTAIHDSVRTYNRYYDHDYWYPDHWYPNSTPSTNSYGIPNASQVNGRYSAAEAIRILRNKNQYNLQNDLMSSSSALDSFERLERAVKDANHVSVNVSSSRSGVPSVFRSGVSITGAAFNASSTNSTVSLVLDAPSVNRYAGRGYQFSMSLTGVGGDSSLGVPVIVSLPLPSDISPNYVKVLHYHNSNTPTVITPQVSGGKIRFPLTGFSDFVVTDGGVPNYTYVSDGYGGYYVPVGSVARQSLVDQHLAAVLPIIAANAAGGYIFDDVSGTYWAAPQIAWVKDGGLMIGYYDGTFRPYSGTTRQELWMVLARLAGANPADMWAAREWAMNVGITDGTNPYAPLSNQQMITMLYRYASYRRMNLTAPTTMLSIYHDSASVSPYARTPMAWAINQGIVTGNGTGYLYPQNIATRADFAVYLYRFLQ